MEWPKQNTGTFAVPGCVQCCTETLTNKYEVRVNEDNSYFWCGGNPSLDGSSSSTLYRTVSWGGSISTAYSNDGCATTEATVVNAYSGSSTISYGYFAPGDPDACSGTLTMTTDGSTTGESNAWNPALSSPIGAGGLTGSSTATSETLSGDGECVASGGLYGSALSTGSATASLSNPFTEDAAIAWRDANYGGRSAWFEVDPADTLWSSGYQPAVGPFVAAHNYVFEHMTVEYRVTRTGYTPGASYNVTMELYRSVWGASSWSLYATVETTLVADFFGRLILTGTAPLARGYSTFPDSSTFTATPA